MSSSYREPKRRRRRMEKFRLGEVSVVSDPMQEPARVAIMKRKEPEALKNKAAITTDMDGHSHTISLFRADSEGISQVKVGHTSFADGHVHDFVVDEGGNITISTVNGHSHGVAALIKASDDLDPIELLAEGVLDASGEDPSSSSETPEEGNQTMTKTEDKTPEGVSREEFDKIAKSNDRLAKVVALSPDHRAHFDGLDEAGQDEFLAKSADERAEILKNLAEADPVVFTDAAGREYRKSDDSRLVDMAKERDEDRRELARERAIRKSREFEKRAQDELPNLGGEVAVKAAILRCIEEGIDDETIKGKALEVLKAKDAGLGVAFQELGTSDSGVDGGGSSASAQLDALADEIFAKSQDPEMTPEKAYVKALETNKGRELQLAMRVED